MIQYAQCKRKSFGFKKNFGQNCFGSFLNISLNKIRAKINSTRLDINVTELIQ